MSTPRFCRHSRFIERCPICRDTVPGLDPPPRSPTSSRRASAGGSATTHSRARPGRGRAKNVRVYSDGAPRGEDDGYRCALVPGLNSSREALRLAEEIAFAAGRLLELGSSPPGLYAEVREQTSWERATWMCFVIAYLSPLQGEDPRSKDPFAGIRRALAEGGGGEGDRYGEETRAEGVPEGGDRGSGGDVPDWRAGELPDLDGIPLGPRTSHDPARGGATLRAYLQWAERAGSQVRAFSGDPGWSEERRFERIFERLTLPGLGRMGCYELLVIVGRLGLYELRADSLHFVGAHTGVDGDPATLAAKRLFGIGDPLILERRARALAEALAVPIDALDLALANWGTGERATLGFPADICDDAALECAREALGVAEEKPQT